MKAAALLDALKRIAVRRDLSGFSVVYAPGNRGAAEALAHELAHAIDLGEDFELSLRAMGDAEANEHELSTLKIEQAAMLVLGMAMSMRRLVKTANWRGIGRPPLSDALAPLTEHEQACAQALVAEVEAEAAA